MANLGDFDAGDFQNPALWTSGKQRNWLLVGLFLSLLLHGLLCMYFYQTRFQPVDAVLASKPPPPTFKVKAVDVDPKPLDKATIDQPNPAAKPEPDKTDVQLPDEKKSFDKLLEEVHANAAMPDDVSNVLPDKPKVEQSDVTSVIKEIERTTAQSLARSPNASREQTLLNDAANSGRPQPALTGTELATSTTIKRPNTFTSNIPRDSAGPSTGRNPGFSDLESLLSQKGPLGSGTAIKMPDDQLFEFGLAELQSSAIQQLQKLGTLIKRNPNAKFLIEGYTDSIGDDEYNIALSQQRADAVKTYLVTSLGINPAQVEARGYGKTKFLVQPRSTSGMSDEQLAAEIARQQPNRRVVVVVQTPGT